MSNPGPQAEKRATMGGYLRAVSWRPGGGRARRRRAALGNRERGGRADGAGGDSFVANQAGP